MGQSQHRLQRDVLETMIRKQEKVVQKSQKALHKAQAKLHALKEQAHAYDTLQVNIIRNGKPYSRRPHGSCTDKKSIARNAKRRDHTARRNEDARDDRMLAAIVEELSRKPILARHRERREVTRKARRLLCGVAGPAATKGPSS